METIKKTWILFDHEGRVLLRQSLTYWILAIHLFLVNAFTLLGPKFFDTSHANLLPQFLNLTVSGCFLIPLLTMGAWSRTTQMKSLPWLFSFPLPLWAVVIAKFLLCWSFALISLASTIPLSFTLGYLGTPDWGVITASYITLAALAAFQVALGLLASSLAPHQLAAFLLAAVANLLFMGLGSHLLFESIPSFLPILWNDRLAPLGIPYHLIAAFRGVLDFRDLLYFAGWTVFGLFMNQTVIYSKRKQQRPGRTFMFAYLSTALLVLILVLFARQAQLRWDMTEEKLYTLSEGTKEIVRKLDRPIFADLYITRNQSDPALKQYGQRIEELLREYSATSPQNFRVKFIDPLPDSEEEVRSRIAGMQAINLKSGESIYLGLAMRQGDQTLSIPVFNLQNEGQLEYELTEAIVKLIQAAKPSVGILSELPIVGDELGENSVLRNDWAFVSALRSLYQITNIPAQSETIPDSLQSLILIHPKNLSEKTLYAVDQYLMRGGKLLIFLDAFCRYEINYPRGGQDHEKFSSQLKRFLDAWGLTFHNETLVGDKTRAEKVTVAQISYDYPLQMQLNASDMNKEMSISKNLQKIHVLESGWLEATANLPKGLQFFPLIETPSTSGVVRTEQTEFQNPQELGRELKSPNKKRVIAGLLKGRIPSAFAQAPEGAVLEHKKTMDQETSIAIVSDVDFLSDPFAVDKVHSMGQMVYKPKGDNINFILNSLEFISGHQDLIAIRSKSQIDRSLWRITDMERSASAKLANQDASLAGKLNEVQEKLAQWESENSEKGQVVAREQLGFIQGLREEEARIRRERKILKVNSEARVEHLKSNILWLHLGFAPASILLGLIWVRQSRRIHFTRSALGFLRSSVRS